MMEVRRVDVVFYPTLCPGANRGRTARVVSSAGETTSLLLQLHPGMMCPAHIELD